MIPNGKEAITQAAYIFIPEGSSTTFGVYLPATPISFPSSSILSSFSLLPQKHFPHHQFFFM